ncbi:MAG: UDP-N-acetylmuramoyl-L-alanyl-D-glutamate--2,6-diaminopimelate ligase [Negativicutes bacterium]|jgi:UDP-N-acetylmuramyl-tripeptide synthetase
MKQLSKLLALLPNSNCVNFIDVDINDITFDSRTVEAGTLFVCIPGAKTDGHEYVEKAVAAGASAVIAERAIETTVPVIYVANTRAAMRILAPEIYDYPSRSMRMIGLTGTNGKTTVTYILKAIFEAAGYKCGVIGTIQSLIGDEIIPVKNTTPDSAELQKILALMRDKSVQYVFMEVSSHALELGRVDGCEFDCVLFTNLTQDHLDFHGTLENYRAAKAKLFAKLAQDVTKQGKFAIINADDDASRYMLTAASVERISYAINSAATVTAQDVKLRLNGCSFVLNYAGEKYCCDLNITGLFNIYNVLAAVSVALAEKVAMATILEALERFQSVNGRFELVNCGQPFAVAVDYAHTPDGLKNILQTAKDIVTNRIIIVFGCGGDRDRTKRPIMGAIATEYADLVIATSDNPRSEDPELILDDVEVGIRAMLVNRSNVEFRRITDRAVAIRAAIDAAIVGDVLLIAGKGHETYQILRDRTIDFDDHKIAGDILREKFGG